MEYSFFTNWVGQTFLVIIFVFTFVLCSSLIQKITTSLMLKSILIAVFLFSGIIVFAQNGATVSGRIFDGETNQPLPFASVTINSAENSSIISGTISNENGRFTHAGIPKGQFVVQCSFVGYQTSEISLLIGER